MDNKQRDKKNLVHFFWNYIEGINGVILIVCFWIALTADMFIVKGFGAKEYLVRWAFIYLLLSILFCPWIIRVVRNICIPSINNERCIYTKWFAVLFSITLLIFLTHYIAFYPGTFQTDPMIQYNQAVENKYSDWHPVIDTLLVMKMPLLLTNGWKGSIVLFQIIEFSIVIAYSCVSVLRYVSKSYTVFAFLFILLNPFTSNYAMYPWKDTTFAMCVLLLVTYCFNIFQTKGEWIAKPFNMVAIIVVFAITTLVRHNAVLFTIPLVFALFFIIVPKRFIIMLGSIVLLILVIKIPLYSALNVEKTVMRQSETLGLPMNVIGAVVKYDPDALDEETKEFAYKVAPKTTWNDKYEYGNYNNLKWDEATDNTVVEEYGRTKIIKMMINCIKSSPKIACYSIAKLTTPLYSLSADVLGNGYPVNSDNNSLIVRTIQKINYAYTGVCVVLLPHLFVYAGSILFVLLIAILSKCKLNKKADWKKILLVIPVFLYNGGTSLLLTSSLDGSRFFYYSFIILPILLAILFKNNDDISKEAQISSVK